MTVIKNVAIFIGKHLCRSLFQSCSLEGCNFIIYKKLLHRFFPINFAKLFRTSVLQNTSRRLLLILFQIKEDISYKKYYFFRFAYTNYFYFTFLKELGNYILCIIRAWSLFCLTLFRWAFSGLLTDGWGGEGGAKRTSPTLKSVTYDETWHSYTLPKEDAKNI